MQLATNYHAEILNTPIYVWLINVINYVTSAIFIEQNRSTVTTRVLI